MQAAVPTGVGGMAAILNIEDALVETLCREASILGQEPLEPANFNSPGQVVIAGGLEAISQAGGFTEIANIKKIKVVHNRAGQKTVVHINGESVMSGQAEDIDLESGDVITVSESVF